MIHYIMIGEAWDDIEIPGMVWKDGIKNQKQKLKQNKWNAKMNKGMQKNNGMEENKEGS